MPLTVGVSVLAAAIMAAAGVLPATLGRRVAGLGPWCAAVLYLLVWGGSVVRYAVGLPVPSPSQIHQIWTWWLNPWGTVLVGAACAAYLVGTHALSRQLRTPSTWMADEPRNDHEPTPQVDA